MDHTKNSKLSFVAEDHYQYVSPPPPSSMNLFRQYPHASHFSNNYLYPMFSTMNKFNELQNEKTQKTDSSFMPREEEEEEEAFSGDYCYSYCDVAAAGSCCAKSDTDSCSQVGDEEEENDDDDNDEVSLDELLQNDAKAKKKIEVLAEMVGVDSTEPVTVLTEVVRVLKHLRRMMN
ncbi:hypothetical protein QN277_000749 [Acacia crassicarpa]|uniref:Uncharacterized protein n=1 Tax=Acacia crassicarpa TaxID=499986 RepID=A0AAE1N5U4_9FABA|nr:hypothetical protein QN277_000749 [Acacia crassicarpa]